MIVELDSCVGRQHGCSPQALDLLGCKVLGMVSDMEKNFSLGGFFLCSVKEAALVFHPGQVHGCIFALTSSQSSSSHFCFGGTHSKQQCLWKDPCQFYQSTNTWLPRCCYASHLWSPLSDQHLQCLDWPKLKKIHLPQIFLPQVKMPLHGKFSSPDYRSEYKLL
jgi:hypothetical protein